MYIHIYIYIFLLLLLLLLLLFFNRNTTKISYSCMNNTKQIIDNHNKRILHSSYSSYPKDNKDGTRTNKIHMGSLTVSGKPLYIASLKIVSMTWVLNLPRGRDSFKTCLVPKKRDLSKNETGRMNDPFFYYVFSTSIVFWNESNFKSEARFFKRVTSSWQIEYLCHRDDF